MQVMGREYAGREGGRVAMLELWIVDGVVEV